MNAIFFISIYNVYYCSVLFYRSKIDVLEKMHICKSIYIAIDDMLS